MGPSPHLWFLQAKQRLLDQNYLSLWVLDLTCRFVHAKHVISTRNSNLCGFQPSSALLCVQKSDFGTRIACLYAFQPSPVVFCLQNRLPSIRLTSLCGSQPSSVVFECKTEPFGRKLQVPMSPRPHPWFCACKTA